MDTQTDELIEDLYEKKGKKESSRSSVSDIKKPQSEIEVIEEFPQEDFETPAKEDDENLDYLELPKQESAVPFFIALTIAILLLVVLAVLAGFWVFL